MSTYVIERDPNRFRGNQQIYTEDINTAVMENVESFHRAVSLKEDLQKLFHKTLASIASTRHSIAVEGGTKLAHLYGVRRDQNPFPGTCGMTTLFKPYHEYNDTLVAYFQNELHKMRFCKEPGKFEFEVSEGKCLERATSTKFSVLTCENSADYTYNFTLEDYEQLCKFCKVGFVKENFGPDCFKELIENREAMQNLRLASPKIYEKFNCNLAIGAVRKELPGKKSDWILVTRSVRINNETYHLSQYLTWMYRDGKSDPVATMKDNSLITVLLQDPFLIDPLLNDTAKIFEKVILWNKKSFKELRDNIALIQYQLAHARPYKNGSIGVRECLEMSLYRYHGYSLSYNSNKLLDMEAHVLSLNEFVYEYDSMIELTRL